MNIFPYAIIHLGPVSKWSLRQDLLLKLRHVNDSSSRFLSLSSKSCLKLHLETGPWICWLIMTFWALTSLLHQPCFWSFWKKIKIITSQKDQNKWKRGFFTKYLFNGSSPKNGSSPPKKGGLIVVVRNMADSSEQGWVLYSSIKIRVYLWGRQVRR